MTWHTKSRKFLVLETRYMRNSLKNGLQFKADALTVRDHISDVGLLGSNIFFMLLSGMLLNLRL